MAQAQDYVRFEAPRDPTRVVKRFDIPEVPPRPEGTREPLELKFIEDHKDSRPVFAAMARGEYKPLAWLFDVPSTIRAASERSIRVTIDAMGIAPHRIVQPVFDALLRHRWSVRVTIAGDALSGAAMIALAGDRRSMPHEGCVMVHPAVKIFAPDEFDAVSRDPSELRRVIAALREADDYTAAIVAARTSLTLEEARAEIERDDILCADEALERGFVHEIQ